jgi:son of sevenless-like protein
VNTQTGQHARDLPQEPDDETSDGDLAGLTSQSSSRSGTSAGLGLGIPASDRGESSKDMIDSANFGILKRNGTPEPWVKKLADDGMSYYYWNRVNGQIEWSKPESDTDTARDSTDPRDQFSSQSSSSTHHPLNRELVPNRLGSETSLHDLRNPQRTGRRLSIYSDNSDPHFFGPDPSALPPLVNGNAVYDGAQVSYAQQPQANRIATQLTSAELLARSLQQALTPSPPELMTDVSGVARKAVAAVLESIQSAVVQRPEDDTMDALVNAVVVGVRNLLYISTPPSNVPGNLMSREAQDVRDYSASQALLKPAQRKVTATLSKLVLSARAMQYDPGSSTNSTPNRIEGDAEDLERAIVAFVLAVERCNNQESVEGEVTGPKRLHGVFSTANVGLGLLGAGAAGGWKGFGWVALDDADPAPSRILGTEVLVELKTSLSQAEERLSALVVASKNLSVDSGKSTRFQTIHFLIFPAADRVTAEGQNAIAQISMFLATLANIHVARHVDIDTSAEDDLYAQTVTKARLLVRTLETAAQSLYDDGATLFLATQNIHQSELGQRRHDEFETHELIEVLTSSLKANLRVVHQTLEALLSVGHDQADMSKGDYDGSIEWRLGRLSVIHDQFGGALHPTPDIPEKSYDAEGEDVVDFALAFRPPVSKTQDNGDIFGNSLYPSDSQASVSTLNHSQSGPSEEASTLSVEASQSTLVASDSPDLPPADVPADSEVLDDDSQSLFTLSCCSAR